MLGHSRIIPQSTRTVVAGASKSARGKKVGKDRLPIQANRKNMKEVEHFPAQQDDRHEHYEDRQYFAKIEPALLLKTPRTQAQDVQRGEAKNQGPQNVVNLVARGDQDGDCRYQANRHLMKRSRAPGSPFPGWGHSKKER